MSLRRRGNTFSLNYPIWCLVGIMAMGNQARADSLLDFATSGSLSTWSKNGNVVVTNGTVNLNLGGNAYALSPAAGHSMAEIQPQGSTPDLSTADSLLGLSNGTLSSVLNANKGSDTSGPTSFGILTKSIALAKGTYNFVWAYAAQDYKPYNDGVLFSLAGNGVNSVTVLADNGPTAPQAQTKILGSYGSTTWATQSFSITTDGTYQLGFADYNWRDTGVNPVFFVSDAFGSVSKNGQSLTPNIDTAQGYYLASNLGQNVNPAFTGGTLKIDNTTPITQNITIDNSGGTIDINGQTTTMSGSLSNASSNTGALTVTNSGSGGMLILNGINTYTGGTTVNSGTLEIGDIDHSTASVAGNVGVNNGGTLRGHGTVGGNISNNGGVLAPGGSIGTLTVNGNYTQSSASTLSIELNPTQTSSLAVGGSATLAGGLAITPDAGTYARGAVYHILTAVNGVTGTFNSVTNTASSIADFAVTYGSNFVDLLSKTGTTSFAATPNLSVNQQGIANTLDAVAPLVTSGPTNDLLNTLVAQPKTQLPQALDTLTNQIPSQSLGAATTASRLFAASLVPTEAGGDSATGVANLAAQNKGGRTVVVADATGVVNATDAIPMVVTKDEPVKIWTQGVGNFTSIVASHGIHGVETSAGGIQFGIEQKPDDDTNLGLSFGVLQENIGINGLPQSGSMKSYGLGVYGSQKVDEFLIDASVMALYNHLTTDRQVGLLNSSARGETDGYATNLAYGMSQIYDLDDGLYVIPRIGLTYTHAWNNAFTEHGADGNNLKISDHSSNRLQSDVGATLATSYHLIDQDDVVRPQLHLGWTHEILNSDSKVSESLSDVQAPSFTNSGVGPGRDAASVKINANYSPDQDMDNLTVYLGYDASLSPSQTSHSMTGGVRLSW